MKTDDVSLRDLRLLSLLFELGSVTRAAQILDVGQSSVSKGLARLRNHFEDPLLVRAGSGMHPTARGMQLIEPLKALLATSDALRAATSRFDPRRSTREFCILVSEVGMIALVPPLLALLQAAGPGLRLKALPLGSRAFETLLEAGEADLALGMFTKVAGAIRRQRLYGETYAGVVRRDHPRLDSLSAPDAVWSERHVLVTTSVTGHGVHRRLEKALSARLRPEQVALSVPSFVSSAYVASVSDLVAIVPAKLAEALGSGLGLATLAAPIADLGIEISQFWHERVHRDEAHAWLRRAVHERFSTHTAHVRSGPAMGCGG